MNPGNLTRLLFAFAISLLAWTSAVSAQGLGGATDTATPDTKTEPENDTLPETDVEPKADVEPDLLPDAEAAPKPEIDKSRLPPRSTYQAMLDANKKTGWVAFRNYNGKQLLYFSALQTLHCRLKEVRYSINSDDLDQRYRLGTCNPFLPFSQPSDIKPKDYYLSFPAGTVEYVAVQVVWEDDSESETVGYSPCPNVGEATCAVLAE